MDNIINKINQLKTRMSKLSDERKLAIFIFVGLIIIIIGNSFSIDTQNKTLETDTEATQHTIVEGSTDSEIKGTEETPEEYLVLSVADGDTIRVEIDGVSTPLRLIGIDTPEINHPSEPIQCFGPEASDKTKELLLNKWIKLEKDSSNTDKYDRLLRYIWSDGMLINELLVRQGFALSSRYPPDIKYQDRLDAAQALAKKDRVGFWSSDTCNGDVYTGTYLDPSIPVEPPVVVVPPPPPVVPAPPVPTPIPAPSSTYTCSCSKTCKRMASCEEAYYQLNTCGCAARDGDKDGIPCESIC